MVSIGNLGVLFPKRENQIESLAFKTIMYLPKESVVDTLELLFTITASTGRRPLISYTTPLIVVYCACNDVANTIQKSAVKNLKQFISAAILGKELLKTFYDY